MIRHKWIVGLRNKVASLACECDSCAAIEGAMMTRTEREELQKLLMKAVNYVDKKIFS